MLSKYNSSQYAPKKVINYSNTSLSLNKSERKTVVNYTVDFPKCNIEIALNVGNGNATYCYVYVTKNGTNVFSHTNKNANLDTTIMLENIVKWDVIKVDIYNPDGTYWQTVSVNNIEGNLIRAAEYTPKKSLPFELKSIGNKLVAYLFGRLPNGIWRDGN